MSDFDGWIAAVPLPEFRLGEDEAIPLEETVPDLDVLLREWGIRVGLRRAEADAETAGDP